MRKECTACQLAAGSGTTRCPVSPGIGALSPFQPPFSRLSSQQTQGLLSSGGLPWLPRAAGGRRPGKVTL